MSYDEPKRLVVYRDPDRERASASEAGVIATGVQFPSGNIVVEWRREAFAEGDRTDAPTESRYGSVEDAEQASGGFVELLDDEVAA